DRPSSLTALANSGSHSPSDDNCSQATFLGRLERALLAQSHALVESLSHRRRLDYAASMEPKEEESCPNPPRPRPGEVCLRWSRQSEQRRRPQGPCNHQVGLFSEWRSGSCRYREAPRKRPNTSRSHV